MNWKELVKAERDVRLNVIADDADIIQEFANSLGFINVKGVATFEVTCICFNKVSSIQEKRRKRFINYF